MTSAWSTSLTIRRPKTGAPLGRAGRRLPERRADLHTVQLFLDHANISTSSRYLKPSKRALHTKIQRIDAQPSCER
jgi:hypothetical protein